MTRRPLVAGFFGRSLAALASVAAVAAVGCGGVTASSESPSKSPAPGADGGVDSAPSPPGCNGAVLIPPTVIAVNAQTSEPICNATVQAVSDASFGAGPNLGVPCSATQPGCPDQGPADAGLSCVLSVQGGARSQAVQVSAPGFEPQTAMVADGVMGCGGGGEPAPVMVSLQPQEAPMCGAIGLVPPTLVVRDAVTGDLICDPVVTAEGEGDGGTTYVDSCAPMAGGGTFGGCPTTPPDGGTLACVFVLFFNGSINPQSQTIVVSAPGYQPTVVPNVMSGVTGCVAMPTPGTQVEVSLTPALPDAGVADGAQG